MIRKAEDHHISVILTKSISRFGRDTVRWMLFASLNLQACALYSMKMGLTDVVDDQLLISVAESFAQAENETSSANIRVGLRNRALYGSSGNYGERLYGCVKNDDENLVVEPTQE